MAIDELRNLDSWESQDFVLPEKQYYPIRIEIGHWQLRNYISAPEHNTIYYAAREHVFALNTKTKVRTYLCPLKFTARCTAAAHGYMIVGGGGEGSFAVIHTGDQPYEVDTALPVNLPRYPASRSNDTAAPLVTYHILGEEIVNSVSIHKLVGRESGIRDDVVAVITNNDKSVRIFSLTQGKETFVVHLRFAANHASMSPCGSLLLAVGDYQEAYFFERIDYKASTVKGRLFNHASSLCDWEILNVVPLHVFRPAQLAAYFTTAWSPDGRLCAVGSECGFITIFDVEVLVEAEDGEDAILAVVPSTRPDAQPQPGAGAPGAVRSMVFSPPPWDLLIWGEDQGRVCVADIRAGLRVRQVLILDPAESDLQRLPISMNIAGLGREQPTMSGQMFDGVSDTRSRAFEYDDPTNTTATSYIRAGQRAPDRAAVHNNSYSNLSLHERQVLDSLRLSDRTPSYQSTENTASRVVDRGLLYTSIGSRDAQPTPAALSDFAAELPALTRSIAASGRDPELAAVNLETIQDYLRRHHHHHHQSRRAFPPTRSSPQREVDGERSSSIQRSGEDYDEETNGRSQLQALIAARERHGRLLSQRVQAQSQRQDGDWQPGLPTVSHLRPIQSTTHATATSSTSDLPSLMSTSTSSGMMFSQLMNLSSSNYPPPAATDALASAANTSDQSSTASPSLSSLETAASRRHRSIQRNRDRGNQHRDSPLGRYQQSLINSRRTMTGHPDPHCGPQTAGIAMSEDGETLWCAAECGIWEFKVNVRGRMGCKAEDLR